MEPRLDKDILKALGDAMREKYRPEGSSNLPGPLQDLCDELEGVDSFDGESAGKIVGH